MKIPAYILGSLLLFGCVNRAAIDSPPTQHHPLVDSSSFALHVDSVVAMEEANTQQAFNGLIVLVCDGQSPIVYTKGFRSPAGKKSPLTTSDVFQLASCSKFFTGIAVLHLLSEYKLSPDDSISPWFPELRPALRRVTIRQLANHTSAIHDYLSLVPTPHLFTNDSVIAVLSGLDSTVYEPGSRWGYTNSGYVLLSVLVERVSGMEYNRYLRKHVLQPLGIGHVPLIPDAKGNLQGFVAMAPDTILDLSTGAHGILVSAEDLFTFFKNRHRFDKEFAAAKQLASPWKDPSWTYGFGWFFSRDSIGEFRAHSGNGRGFQSYIRIYENRELMLFILSNKEDEIVRPIRERVIGLLQEEINSPGKK
jgi:CubicO group peptidase (beta-lactamase class C family)